MRNTSNVRSNLSSESEIANLSSTVSRSARKGGENALVLDCSRSSSMGSREPTGRLTLVRDLRNGETYRVPGRPC